MIRAIEWLAAHPEIVALATLLWPTLTGALSFVHTQIARRFPLVVQFLKASGLDIPKVARVFRLLFRKRLSPTAQHLIDDIAESEAVLDVVAKSTPPPKDPTS